MENKWVRVQVRERKREGSGWVVGEGVEGVSSTIQKCMGEQKAGLESGKE